MSSSGLWNVCSIYYGGTNCPYEVWYLYFLVEQTPSLRYQTNLIIVKFLSINSQSPNPSPKTQKIQIT